jgi:hypothetical protein
MLKFDNLYVTNKKPYIDPMSRINPVRDNDFNPILRDSVFNQVNQLFQEPSFSQIEEMISKQRQDEQNLREFILSKNPLFKEKTLEELTYSHFKGLYDDKRKDEEIKMRYFGLNPDEMQQVREIQREEQLNKIATEPLNGSDMRHMSRWVQSLPFETKGKTYNELKAEEEARRAPIVIDTGMRPTEDEIVDSSFTGAGVGAGSGIGGGGGAGSGIGGGGGVGESKETEFNNYKRMFGIQERVRADDTNLEDFNTAMNALSEYKEFLYDNTLYLFYRNKDDADPVVIIREKDNKTDPDTPQLMFAFATLKRLIAERFFNGGNTLLKIIEKLVDRRMSDDDRIRRSYDFQRIPKVDYDNFKSAREYFRTNYNDVRFTAPRLTLTKTQNGEQVIYTTNMSVRKAKDEGLDVIMKNYNYVSKAQKYIIPKSISTGTILKRIIIDRL